MLTRTASLAHGDLARILLAVRFYDVVLWAHVTAVVVAFGGTFTYPVWFLVVTKLGG